MPAAAGGPERPSARDGTDDPCSRGRAEMVSLVHARGVRDPGVLAAMRRIPRELFVPPELVPRAFEDSALPIDSDQTISQPYMVGAMTELLELDARDRVLEVGTGSGYQTAILACRCAALFTIEWHRELLHAALERLRGLELTARIESRCGDGSLGWPEHAPYDAILVTAGAPDVPAALREQLAVGGRLIVPVGDREDQTLVRVRRTPGGWLREQFFGCRFVKLLGAAGWAD